MNTEVENRQEEQVKIKRTEISKWLSKNGYETIEPLDFYRFMFPKGELVEYNDRPRSPEANKEWKYNAILLENTHKKKSVMKVDPQDRNKPEHLQRKYKSEKEIWKNYIILDDLDRIDTAVKQFGQTDSEFFIAPNSYLGRRRTKETERWIYACIIEIDHPITEVIDGHRQQTGMIQLVHEWTKSSIPYLMPSAIVSSGSGVHLIYFLDRAYQISDEYQKEQWDNFRHRFTKRVWNQRVTKAPMQYENHCQSFRVVGTRTKKGHKVEAFWVSKKRYTIDELFSQVKYDEVPTWQTFEEFLEKADQIGKGFYEPEELMKREKKKMPKGEKQLSPKLQAAKEKWPKWYQERIIEKQPKKEPGQWECHRGLYDWYLREAKENAVEGCRYHRIHALAEFAVKCRIEYEEFKKDAWELYEIYKDVDAKDPFRYIEFVKARDEYFNKMSHKSTRKWIEENARIKMNPPAKRNGRKRKEHLHADYWKETNENGKIRRSTNVCKQNRELHYWDAVDEGIVGRPDKQAIIQEWRKNNPDKKKSDCIRETGISKPTVYKWWDC